MRYILSNGTIPDPVRQNFFWLPPIISGMGKATDFKYSGRVYSQGLSAQKPIKTFGEKGLWAYPGTAQMFWCPS